MARREPTADEIRAMSLEEWSTYNAGQHPAFLRRGQPDTLAPAAPATPIGRDPRTVDSAEVARLTSADRRAYMAALTGRVEGGFEAEAKHLGPFRALSNEERLAHPFARNYATNEPTKPAAAAPAVSLPQNLKPGDVANLSREQKEALAASAGFSSPKPAMEWAPGQSPAETGMFAGQRRSDGSVAQNSSKNGAGRDV